MTELTNRTLRYSLSQTLNEIKLQKYFIEIIKATPRINESRDSDKNVKEDMVRRETDRLNQFLTGFKIGSRIVQ